MKIGSSETSVSIYMTTSRDIADDCTVDMAAVKS
jgi:hypothetical protein